MISRDFAGIMFAGTALRIGSCAILEWFAREFCTARAHTVGA